MSHLTEHYRLLLGLDFSWEVSDVSLFVEEKRVEISLRHRGGRVMCPECGVECSIADHAPERTWRHLDTMQFETRLCPGASRQLPDLRREDHRGSLGGQAFAIHLVV